MTYLPIKKGSITQMPKLDTPTTPPPTLPDFEPVALTEVPIPTNEVNAADAAYRDKLAAAMAQTGAAATQFTSRTDAENAGRRITRLLKPLAPDGQAARTSLGKPDANGATRLYVRWGEKRKGGRPAATPVTDAPTPRDEPVTTAS